MALANDICESHLISFWHVDFLGADDSTEGYDDDSMDEDEDCDPNDVKFEERRGLPVLK